MCMLMMIFLCGFLTTCQLVKLGVFDGYFPMSTWVSQLSSQFSISLCSVLSLFLQNRPKDFNGALLLNYVIGGRER